MRSHTATKLLGLLSLRLLLAQNPVQIERAAAKYAPGVSWQPRSVILGNFTCRGRKEPAILGVSASEIVIAVFANGLNMRPEILRYSAKARNARTAKLAIEDQDYDPKQDIGREPPGFRRSKSCKGLNLTDGLTDSAHIYWNRASRRFEDWTL
jgi:hypothetical protein